MKTVAFHVIGQRTNLSINSVWTKDGALGEKRKTVRRKREREKEEAKFLYHSLPKTNFILVYCL